MSLKMKSRASKTVDLAKFSERPNGQKRGSAEPERFGHFYRTFGRTVRPNFGQIWAQILAKNWP